MKHTDERGPTAAPSVPGRLPLVGREADVAALVRALDAAEQGHGSTVFLAGEGGVGKTRLALAVAEIAERRGFPVAIGRAYQVETGVPYALFSDAFVPLLRALEPGALAVLSRGGEAEISQLFPALAAAPGRAAPRGDPSEVKARLLWNFSQLLGRMAAKRPMLVVLENLQWADASSLELLHFLARQLGSQRVMLLCSYNEAEREVNATLPSTERSLIALGAATVQRVAPLTPEQTAELVTRSHLVDASAARVFGAVLYDRTRGNPFFIEEMLKTLAESGRLRAPGPADLGSDLELDLPRTIRDALVARLGRLSAPARSAADFVAVLGTRVPYETLEAVTGLRGEALVAAIEELCRERVLEEIADGASAAYDVTHPLLRSTLYAELGRARARLLHGAVARALETRYGARAEAHANELAFHFARADAGENEAKAARYLAAAGRAALASHAAREAADYLDAALAIHDRAPDRAPLDAVALGALVGDLARARQRTGDYATARSLLERARSLADAAGDAPGAAALERRLGLSSLWSGRHVEALAHFEAGLALAGASGEPRVVTALRAARAAALIEIGRPDDAKAEGDALLAAAEASADPALLARAHRTLALMLTWTGPASRAREHAQRALDLSRTCGEPGVAWSAHWTMAVLAGLTGSGREVAEHVAESERLAEQLRSPVLGVWTAEVSIEYSSAVGDWDAGLARAERTIPVARQIGRRTLLPRLLVWTGLMHLGRGEIERAKSAFDESWALSGAALAGDGPVDVHTVVPAHVGMAAYHVAMQDYQRAIAVGEAGLAIVDRSGYLVWAIHRLLPVLIEASLWAVDYERAERLGARLRRDSAQLGHPLGLAWATASDALQARLRDRDAGRAIALMRSAVEELDAIPFALDASRLRRNLAQLLAAEGDREGAARELRLAHEVFARIGAEGELRGTRDQLRALGTRPPVRAMAEGVGALTGREVEIARLVAGRKSNKEIGTALGISARTVSTHLSNIFGKLGVTSRGELTDLVRDGGVG